MYFNYSILEMDVGVIFLVKFTSKLQHGVLKYSTVFVTQDIAETLASVKHSCRWHLRFQIA